MSTRFGLSLIAPGTAERLLRGGRGAWNAGDHRLAGLLAAATAPARAGELVLEEAIVAAFREAHRSSIPQLQRRSMIKSAVTKLLTVKVAAVCAAVVGLGGVALAASAGNLPSPLNRAAPSASEGPGNGQAGPANRANDPASKPAVPSGFPPGLYWLCHDYIGRDADHRGKALEEAKFQALVAQAGKDQEKADKFCAKLVNDQSSGSQADAPAGTSDRPVGTPDGQKPSHAADLPTNRPSGPSTPHPSR